MATKNKDKPRKSEAEKRRPAFEARYGRLRVSVWRQDSEKGPWFNVNLSRSYKNAEGSWQTSTSFGVRDLLEVAKLCDMAHTYIYGVLASEHTENAQDRNEPVEVEVPS